MHKSHAEVEAMKRQTKGLAQEYDRLLREHHQLQVTTYITEQDIHVHAKLQSQNTYTDPSNAGVIHFFMLFHLQNLQCAEDKKDQ